MSKNPAVTVAKEKVTENRERVLSTGVNVRIVPISASLIMEVQQHIPFPPVPIVYDEEKNQTYENPNHPSYLRGVEEVETMRSTAAMDAIIMFGVELLDGIPKDDTWLRKLKTMDKNGAIGLKVYDLEDPIDLEFLYKKFIAVSSDDFQLISSMAGVTQEGIEAAEDSFQNDA